MTAVHQVGPLSGGAIAAYAFKWLNRAEVLSAADDVSKGWALYVMEALGTFYLVRALSLSVSGGFQVLTHVLQVLTVSLTSNPLCIGMILSAMIYSGAHISGAHYNPVRCLCLFFRHDCVSTGNYFCGSTSADASSVDVGARCGPRCCTGGCRYGWWLLPGSLYMRLCQLQQQQPCPMGCLARLVSLTRVVRTAILVLSHSKCATR